jgi:UDP-N-acetyl-D-glucosamine dehydrogenase
MSNSPPSKLVLVGQGYVGLPVAIRAAEAGYDVVGYDLDEAKIKRLAAGESPVEDIADTRLGAALASGRYHPSDRADDCRDFDVAIISVPTPLNDGTPDLRHIEEATHTIGEYLTAGATVVLESTTYPGTTEELVGPILEDESGLIAGRDFHLGYSPERIDPGNAEWRFENTPKVVSGVTPSCLDVISTFYSRLVDQVVEVSSPKEAELTKLLENTFRHVNIALVNELAVFANELGIDVWEAIDAASTKPFGYLRFTPGPGVGGHCLPIDPSYLSWQVRRSLGRTFRFVELANDVNDHMPDYVVQRLIRAFNERGLAVKGRRILLLGLSYKRNTGDARESPSGPIARQLIELGADVVAADPHVIDSHVPGGVLRVDASTDEVAAADAVVLLVDHDEFDLDDVLAHARLIFDTRHRTSGPNVEHL